MRDWEPGDTTADGLPTDLRPVKTYRLEPGQAHLYDVGEIHSIHPADESRYVRIAGTPNDVFRPMEQASD